MPDLFNLDNEHTVLFQHGFVLQIDRKYSLTEEDSESIFKSNTADFCKKAGMYVCVCLSVRVCNKMTLTLSVLPNCSYTKVSSYRQFSTIETEAVFSYFIRQVGSLH